MLVCVPTYPDRGPHTFAYDSRMNKGSCYLSSYRDPFPSIHEWVRPVHGMYVLHVIRPVAAITYLFCCCGMFVPSGTPYTPLCACRKA